MSFATRDVETGALTPVLVERHINNEVAKEFLVFNATDGVYASPEAFKTREEAEMFCAEFRNRFKAQGYYSDSNWNKISPDDIQLRIQEVD
jgi:hypothetical protein